MKWYAIVWLFGKPDCVFHINAPASNEKNHQQQLISISSFVERENKRLHRHNRLKRRQHEAGLVSGNLDIRASVYSEADWEESLFIAKEGAELRGEPVPTNIMQMDLPVRTACSVWEFYDKIGYDKTRKVYSKSKLVLSFIQDAIDSHSDWSLVSDTGSEIVLDFGTSIMTLNFSFRNLSIKLHSPINEFKTRIHTSRYDGDWQKAILSLVPPERTLFSHESYMYNRLNIIKPQLLKLPTVKDFGYYSLSELLMHLSSSAHRCVYGVDFWKVPGEHRVNVDVKAREHKDVAVALGYDNVKAMLKICDKLNIKCYPGEGKIQFQFV